MIIFPLPCMFPCRHHIRTQKIILFHRFFRHTDSIPVPAFKCPDQSMFYWVLYLSFIYICKIFKGLFRIFCLKQPRLLCPDKSAHLLAIRASKLRKTGPLIQFKQGFYTLIIAKTVIYRPDYIHIFLISHIYSPLSSFFSVFR